MESTHRSDEKIASKVEFLPDERHDEQDLTFAFIF